MVARTDNMAAAYFNYMKASWKAAVVERATASVPLGENQGGTKVKIVEDCWVEEAGLPEPPILENFCSVSSSRQIPASTPTPNPTLLKIFYFDGTLRLS